MLTHTSSASVGNKWPELRFGNMDVDVVAVAETWLRSDDGNNNLTVRDYPAFRVDRADWRLTGGKLILVAEKYNVQESHKLETPNIQAPEINIANGGSRTSTAPKQAKDMELFLLRSAVARSVGKLPTKRNFNSPEIDWVCETVRQSNC